jgi:hypothetical protein
MQARGICIDRNGARRRTGLPASIAFKSALGSPSSSLETSPVARITCPSAGGGPQCQATMAAARLGHGQFRRGRMRAGGELPDFLPRRRAANGGFPWPRTAAVQRCPVGGATVRRLMRQESPSRLSSWVIRAAARMAGGTPGSMISSTDRATA